MQHDREQHWILAERLEVTRLADDIWMHTTWAVLDGGYRVPSNGLIVRDGDELILVDMAWGVDVTEKLLDWIDREIGLPVTAAVVTHFHDDRMSGTPALNAHGIPYFSTEHTRTLTRTEETSDLPQSLGELDKGETVPLGRTQILYPGPGHTADNIVVWLEAENLLFGGCAIRPGNTDSPGNTADADMKHWPSAIRLLQRKFPHVQTVIPAHGSPGDADLLQHTLNILN